MTASLLDYAWCWRSFGDQMILVTDGGGAKVVLAPPRNQKIMTRDPDTGTLRVIKPDDEIARIIAATPLLRKQAQSLINGIDTGLISIDTVADETLAVVLSGLRVALKAGAA